MQERRAQRVASGLILETLAVPHIDDLSTDLEDVRQAAHELF